MGEELSRWLEAARPAMPWALGALALFVAGGMLAAFLVRRQLADARRNKQRAEHLWHNIDCVVEPTRLIDMREALAEGRGVKFDALTVLTDVRERLAAASSREQASDWTPEELASVRSMTDRSGWPNTTYQPRGFLPRLRPPRMPAVTPKDIGERIARIRAEQQLETRNA